MKESILLIAALATLAGWLMGCAGPSSSDAWIAYRRSGGFAGFDDHLVIEKNGEATLTRRTERYEFALDDEAADRLQTLFEQAQFSQLRKEYLPSQQGSDRFEYVLTYRGHTVRTMDGAVPPSLQPVLEALNQIIQNHGTG